MAIWVHSPPIFYYLADFYVRNVMIALAGIGVVPVGDLGVIPLDVTVTLPSEYPDPPPPPPTPLLDALPPYAPDPPPPVAKELFPPLKRYP
jgi:hypothetical protein